MSNQSEDVTITIPGQRIVGFVHALKLGFKNYFQFEGRSSRGAYWYWTLWILILSFVAAICDAIFFNEMFEETDGNGPIGIVLTLVTLIPGIALAVRRLHDIGRSGWWNLIAITIIGIIPLIYWACKPGDRHENRFGPDAEAGRA